MLTEPLPEFIRPRQLAERGRTLRGGIELRAMMRLCEQLVAPSGTVEVDLRFFTRGSRYCVSGRIQASVQRVCQRCLMPVREALDAGVRLALVESEMAAGSLPEEYDPLLCTADALSLFDLVEDELMLALPIVAAHARGECQSGPVGKCPDQAPADRPNPFAVLSRLKTSD